MVKLIDVRTAARRLGVDEKTVRNMIHNGRLPHCKVGAKCGYRVPAEAVDALLLPRLEPYG